MDGYFMSFPLLLAFLLLVVGAILGAIAFFKIQQLERKIFFLEHLLQQRPNLTVAQAKPTSVTPPNLWIQKQPPLPATRPPSNNTHNAFIEHLRRHWMAWLGGVSIGLAGVFMVRYSIEQQLLGPQARLVLAALVGIVLHVLAEWLRRNKGSEPAFAALAGGASIVLYASLVSSLRLLDNPPVAWVFMGMALVSAGTMLLALRHGPLLAALGMLGGYLVPLLVDSGSGKMEYALIYVLIVSLFTLWLKAYVQKQWLWQGVAVAGLAWWLISFTGSPSFDARSAYLVVLLYLLVAVPWGDWRLQQSTVVTQSSWWEQLKAVWQQHEHKQLWIVALALVIAQGVTWWVEDIGHVGYISLLLMPLLLAQLALRRPEFNSFLALLLTLTAVCWLFYTQGSAPELQAIGLRLLVLTALYVALAWLWYPRVQHYASFWLALGCAAPLLMLAVAYYQLDFVAQDWAWSLAAAILGAAYTLAAWHPASATRQVVLFSAAHVAYSLAAAIALQEMSLTIALAAQLLSLTWLLHRYQLQGLGWALRLVLFVVVLRLTLNPWLLNYGNGNSWVPWTYTIALLFSLISLRSLQTYPKLQPWLIAGCGQLAVLALAVWVRWWLYEGQIYQTQFSFTEASIYVPAWGALALLYQWRAQKTAVSKNLYQLLATLHGVAVLMLYVLYLLLSHNPLWANINLHGTPIINVLLLSYGLPSLLLLAWLKQINLGYWPAPWRAKVAIVVAINAWWFISIEIRHLWHLQGTVHWQRGMPMGELYTYSIVWLLAALACLLVAMLKNNLAIYRGGIILLLVVVAKIFLLDMAGLTGLWRVASFMGLGLVLLALAWMYQRKAGTWQITN